MRHPVEMTRTGRPRVPFARTLLVAACMTSCMSSCAADGDATDATVVTAAPSTTVGPASTAVATTTTAPVATSTTVARPIVTRVLLLGDSLAEEAEEFLPGLLGDVQFATLTLGGTAPCDWFTNDLQPSPTTVIVVSFHGNSLTSCMKDEAGNYLRKGALVAKYANDLGYLLDKAATGGALVLLVGQPVDRMLDDGTYGVVPALNELYQQLAAERGLHYVDAGASVEAPDGGFAQQLPCSPDDLQCGADGMNAVRSDDGMHLCPGPTPTSPCRSYSAGAYRYALAIARALEQW